LKIPSKPTNELAEIVGIHIGDGHVSKFSSNYQVQISSNLHEDKYYMDNVVAALWKRTFNVVPSKRVIDNEYRFIWYSRAIYSFLTGSLGLPSGNKQSIKIPDFIVENNSFLRSALRGIFDTDFSLSFKNKWKQHRYPVMMMRSSSKKLIPQLKMALEELGLKPSMQKNVVKHDKRFGDRTYNEIYLNGKKNIRLWWKEIGSKNPRMITRYKVWDKFGFCPPNTTLEQRLAMLNGEIDPESLER
jgi:hypothetical protein